VQDAGSAGFRYAAALDAFFRPAALTGVEVEGHRLLRDGRSRIDHARGYVAPFPHARFVVADYTAFDESADVITMFYPFVTVAPLLAWRLPLEVFAPEAWFARAARNLAPGGLLVVVSHGDDEAGIAKRLCAAQDLTAVVHPDRLTMDDDAVLAVIRSWALHRLIHGLAGDLAIFGVDQLEHPFQRGFHRRQAEVLEDLGRPEEGTGFEVVFPHPHMAGLQSHAQHALAFQQSVLGMAALLQGPPFPQRSLHGAGHFGKSRG